jgi:phage baseplate assembly protein W
VVERPHIAFPFGRDARTGKVTVVEQDTHEHVNSCCQVIIRCPVGFRWNRPDFGIPYPEFPAVPFDDASVRAAIRTLEPRCSNVEITQWQDPVEPSSWHLSIDVEAR